MATEVQYDKSTGTEYGELKAGNMFVPPNGGLHVVCYPRKVGVVMNNAAVNIKTGCGTKLS